ncbi:MAG: hypothetical protein IJ393_05025 [Clostridia bacterium]|nr:hypothetical protein [Clostridia bacterium]
MRRKFIVVALTVLIFLSVAILGFATIYRVDEVTLKASVVSDAAKEEAQALQNRLTEAYKKDGILFADDEEAQEIIKEFPYFRITGFEKDYPNRLIISIQEDAEVYAVAQENSPNYYILGEDGTVLGIRETYINRLNGEENVLLKGLNATGEKGKALSGDTCIPSMLTLCKALSENLDGIRKNVVSVEVYSRSPELIYRITMREGVAIYVGAPETNTAEKAKMAIDKYLSLTNEEKLTGRIMVSDSTGTIVVVYSPIDNF